MAHSDIDPDGIYYLNMPVTGAGTVNLETGEVTEIENVVPHTHRTAMTGQQVLDWQERLKHDPRAQFDHTVRDTQFLVGEDGELIESDSAVPPDHDEP